MASAAGYVQIEFYGIPRARAGVPSVSLPIEGDFVTLGQVLSELVKTFPGLAEDCIVEGELVGGFVANVAGEKFVYRGSEPIAAGSTLLILSADAGG